MGLPSLRIAPRRRTPVDIDGARATTHCIESAPDTYHGEEWVTVDLVVRGDRMMAHVVERRHRDSLHARAVPSS
jgi:hypothetical protein